MSIVSVIEYLTPTYPITETTSMKRTERTKSFLYCIIDARKSQYP